MPPIPSRGEAGRIAPGVLRTSLLGFGGDGYWWLCRLLVGFGCRWVFVWLRVWLWGVRRRGLSRFGNVLVKRYVS